MERTASGSLRRIQTGTDSFHPITNFSAPTWSRGGAHHDKRPKDPIMTRTSYTSLLAALLMLSSQCINAQQAERQISTHTVTEHAAINLKSVGASLPLRSRILRRSRKSATKIDRVRVHKEIWGVDQSDPAVGQPLSRIA
jgi:hypothetical protein